MHQFQIRGVDRLRLRGDHRRRDDRGISFPCYRRVATIFMIPGAPLHSSAMEMISISSVDLADAQRIDASASRE